MMCRFIYSLLLLLSFFGAGLGSLLTSLSVHPGENITLPCDVRASAYTSWYRLSRNELTLIISVKINQMYPMLDYNADESHFQPIIESLNDSASLSITAVKQSDVGVYYCSRHLRGLQMHFGKPILLTVPGSESPETDTGLCWKLLIIIACVLALITTLCVSTFLYKLGLCSSSCMNCVKENSNLKVAELQYASLRHAPKSPQAETVIVNPNVTYDVVAKKIPTNHRA